MHEVYKAKNVLNVLNVHKHCDGGWFWDKYSAAPYMGCEYGCTYCYARQEKYNPYKTQTQQTLIPKEPTEDEFSEHIRIKQNAPELLAKQLSKIPKDIITLHGYQPIDAKYQYVRKMLEVCYQLGFPVFVNEKSPLLLRDIDVLEKISKASYLNVGWSIIGAEQDPMKAVFEPNSPPFETRFEAMKKLAERGIYTGTIFMPILPFIYDNEEHIKKVVKKTRESGGKYVLEGGLSLEGQCRTYFYKALEAYDANLISKYDELYSNPKLMAQELARIHRIVVENCREQGLTSYIPRPTSFYPKELQTNRRIAEKFYLKARELQLCEGDNFRQWAYRKAAWALDDLDKDVEEILKTQGVETLQKIEGVGKSIASKIAVFIEEKNSSAR